MDEKFLSFQLRLPTYLFILVKEFCSAEDVSRLYFYTRLKHQIDILIARKLMIIQWELSLENIFLNYQS